MPHLPEAPLFPMKDLLSKGFMLNASQLKKVVEHSSNSRAPCTEPKNDMRWLVLEPWPATEATGGSQGIPGWLDQWAPLGPRRQGLTSCRLQDDAEDAIPILGTTELVTTGPAVRPKQRRK